MQEDLLNIESAIEDPTTFWEKLKHFNNSENMTQETKIPGLKLFQHFSNLHLNNNEVMVPENPKINIATNEGLNKPFSKKEFNNTIDSLKINKSAGHDSITNEMIKASPEIMLNTLHRFMNLCLKNI